MEWLRLTDLKAEMKLRGRTEVEARPEEGERVKAGINGGELDPKTKSPSASQRSRPDMETGKFAGTGFKSR